MRSRNEMMNLNNQLLEAIQRKLELSQELEAWQVRNLSRALSHTFTHTHEKQCVYERKVRVNFFAAT